MRSCVKSLVAIVALAVCVAVVPVAAQDAGRPQELIDAERMAAAGEWDQIGVVLTSLIQRLDALPRDARTGRLLIEAYERRALARLQTGDRTNAAIDFTALLQIDPNHTFAAPSPALQSLFDQTRASTLASLDLTIKPGDATLVLEKDGANRDSLPAARMGTQWLTAGSYRLIVRKLGYESRTETLDLKPGVVQRLPVELRRTSAVVFIRTIPSGVKVHIDGELRGTTVADPNGDIRSQTLTIEGLVPRPTPYQLRAEKDCFVPDTSELRVPPLEVWKEGPSTDPLAWDPDRRYDQVALRPAFGTIDVAADQAAAIVLIDGQRRGTAGKPITDVCQGEHSLQVQTATGQFSQRVRVEVDKQVRVQANLIPTYGVAGAGRANDASGAPPNLAGVIETLPAKNVKFVRTELSDAELGSLTTLTGEDLRRAADGVIQRTDTQGIATVARVAPDAEGRDVELRLFVAGASKPDVLRFSLQDRGLQQVTALIDAQVPVVTPSLGIDVVDIMRIDGAVVASVDPSGPAAGRVVPGDVIVGVGVSGVSNAASLTSVIEKASEPTVNLRIRDKPGPVSVAVQRQPTVVSMYDARPFNAMIAELNARIARQLTRGDASSAEEQRRIDGMRLNLGVALMAVGNYEAAQQTLGQVRLDGRRGVSKGTVDYLRAICFKQLGQLDQARTLFEAAAKEPDARLNEGGPAVSYLANEQLLGLKPGAQK